ncbi:MAG: sigma-70 family RNA polymerase sigma factor [Prevotella sp.]|nr:sigma-70 family RNA polymerase sigma factor [Prevotella sp.]
MTSAEFQTLASTLRPRLLAQATRYLRDTAEAEDIVQDAMLKMWVLHDQLIGNAEAFASVLVRNLSLNRLRQLHRMQTLTEMDLLEMERLDAESRSQQDTDEQVAQLMSLVEALPDRQKTILRLHDLEGMDYDEIAQVTGLSAASLRQTVSRARRLLCLRYLAAVSAVVAVLVVGVTGYRALQNYQLDRRYEGSYIVVAGERNDNLRQIRPQLEQTLAAASHVEATISEQDFVRQAEADVLQNISDPEERRRLQELLKE